MESPRNDVELSAALRALRPSPRAEFAAELDARVAAGFPPRGPRGHSPIRALAARIRAMSTRQLLAPAGGFAVAAIVIATAVVAISESEPTTSRLSGPASSQLLSGGEAKIPGAGRAGTYSGDAHLNSAPAVPLKRALLNQSAADSAAANSAATAGKSSYSGGAERLSFEAAGVNAGANLRASGQSLSGPFASQARRRNIERSAQLVLATEAAEVRGAAAKVFAAVHSYDGIVLNSSIRDGGEGEAAATFDLLIPSGKLSDALASFSEIGEVRSRHEATRDITAPTIGLGERLQDSQAKIESLLAQLAEATTDAERAASEAALRAERRHAAALRSRLAALQRRASFSRVSLRIESGEAAAGTAGESRWGVGDAAEDAGHILATAAAVTVIGLAILAPIVLICLLAWLGRTAWVRHARRRALSRS